MTAKRENKTIQLLMTAVFAVSVLGVVGLLWYISGSGRSSRRPYPAPMPRNIQPLTENKSLTKPQLRAMFLGNSPMSFTPGVGYPTPPMRVPQGFPRYFANMSTTVGEYIVSVRQVADFEQNLTLYENNPVTEIRPPVSRLNLSLQVMAATQEPIDRIKEFAPKVKAVDDKGSVQESKEVSNIAKFDRGIARILIVPPPAAGAKFYKTIQGFLTVTENGKDQQIPFTLTNIPLPTENHLFGFAATKLLPALPDNASLSRDSTGMLLREAATVLDNAFPPFTTETGPLKLPNRLILVPGATHRIPLSLPTPQGEMPMLCTLTTHPQAESAATVTCRLEAVANAAKPLEWKFQAWENDPIILTFRANHFFPDVGQTAGLRLLLFSHSTYETLPTMSPIPADKVTQSGSLIVQVRVGSSPLRSGKAKVELLQRDSSSERRGTVTVELNEEGIGHINNVPPGNYEIALKDVFPYHNNLTPLKEGMPAVTHRYRLIQPKIIPQVQKNLLLRPGGLLKLQTWRVTESKVASR